MSTEEITIPTARGTELRGFLDRPAGTPLAYAVFAHCFTCSAKSPAASRISRALTDEGFAVLRFDFAGLGGSEGDFAESTFSSDRADLLEVIAWLGAHHAAPRLLIGHSLGGAAVLSVAAEVEGLDAVATIAAPFDPGHVTGLFASEIETIRQEGSAEVMIGGRPVVIGEALVDDICGVEQTRRIEALRTPLLILHSPTDEIVDVHNAQAIYRTAHQPKSFIALDGADHLLTGPGQGTYTAGVIAAWAAWHIDAPEDAEAPHADLPPGRVRVNPDGRTDFGTVLATASHTWLADEPRSVDGGHDAGPNPVDLLLAALGACTSMTMGMYARRKGYELGDIRTDLTFRQVKRDGDLVTRIERSIVFDAELSTDQRRALLRIADRCPVHRALEGRFEISTAEA